MKGETEMKTKTWMTPTRHGIWGAVLAAALGLVGCGGGTVDVAAVGSSGTGAGTITGFGSVFIDGQEYENATTPAYTIDADGSKSVTSLQLGQRVRLGHDGKGTATSLVVDAAVLGKVTAVDATAGTLTVAAQNVTTNTDSTAGPVTRYGGGLTQLSDVTVDMVVEVHGSPVYSSSTNSYTVQATRIEKKSGVVVFRVVGTVASYDSTAKTFKLGNLTIDAANATVLPTTATIADGKTVRVYGNASDLSGSTFKATNVHVTDRVSPDGSSTTGKVSVGGKTSLLDTTAKTFSVGGVTVNYSSATITPSTAAVANDVYVRAEGTLDSGGILQATKLHIQRALTDLLSIELKGTITDFVDSSSFSVRGVPVDASGVTPSNCSVALADGVVVAVRGNAQTGTQVIKATEVKCLSTDSSKRKTTDGDTVIHDYRGAITAVDSGNSQFTMVAVRRDGSVIDVNVTQKVQWSTTTYFGGLTSADLAVTKLVRVEGSLDSAGVLIAKEVRADGSSDGDNTNWTDYRRHH